MPQDGTDERLQHRHMQLFRVSTINEEQEDAEGIEQAIIMFSSTVAVHHQNVQQFGHSSSDPEPQLDSTEQIDPTVQHNDIDGRWTTAIEQDEQ